MKPFGGNVGAACNSNFILSVITFVPHLFYFETYRNAWMTKSFLMFLFMHQENWKHLSFVSHSYWFVPWLDSEVQFSLRLSTKWGIHRQWSWEGWDFPIDVAWWNCTLSQASLTARSICVCVQMCVRDRCGEREQKRETNKETEKQIERN